MNIRYTASIHGKTGQFDVIASATPTPEPTEAPPVTPTTDWWLIVGIIAGVVALGFASYLFVRRQRKAKA